jgi:hypothetical protein
MAHYLVVVLHPDVFGTGGNRDAVEVDRAERRAGLAVEGDLLGLGDLRQFAVVEHVVHQAQSQPRGGDDLHAGHGEGAVADDGEHLALRIDQLGADGAGTA